MLLRWSDRQLRLECGPISLGLSAAYQHRHRCRCMFQAAAMAPWATPAAAAALTVATASTRGSWAPLTRHPHGMRAWLPDPPSPRHADAHLVGGLRVRVGHTRSKSKRVRRHGCTAVDLNGTPSGKGQDRGQHQKPGERSRMWVDGVGRLAPWGYGLAGIRRRAGGKHERVPGRRHRGHCCR